MKQIFYLLLCFALASCSGDDNNEPTDTLDGEALRTSLTGGDWRISNYSDDNVDRTGDFEGYVFTFNADGTLAVTDQSTSLSGAWSISDVGSDDSSDNDVDLNLFFASPDLFEELTEDWDVVTVTGSRVTLEDEDDSFVDLLTFERL